MRQWLRVKEVQDEVEKALHFEPSLTEFLIATTSPRDEKVQQESRRLTDVNVAQGKFTVCVWSWEDILEELDLHPEVTEWYWPIGISQTNRVSVARRLEILDDMLLMSHGRRVARWQAAGLSRDEAVQLSSDYSVGVPDESVIPTEAHPLRIIVGDVGSGKSLAVERYLQHTIHDAQRDTTAPFPVYVNAISLSSDLQTATANEMGNVRQDDVVVIVDGLDEISTFEANRILDEVDPHRDVEGRMGGGGPRMTVQWEALPHGQSTEVSFTLGTIEGFPLFADREVSDRLYQTLRRNRPDASETIGITRIVGRAHDMLDDNAIIDTAYRWLEEDLRRIGWMP